jgi:hypothetical protein
MEQNQSKKSFTAFVRKNLSQIIGIVLGIVGGYIYYRTVGCSSGSCTISGNVWLSMSWGAAAGYLAGGMLRPGDCGCGFSTNSTCEKK